MDWKWHLDLPSVHDPRVLILSPVLPKVETWSWAGVQMVPTWQRPGLAAVLGACRMQLALLTMPNAIYTTRIPLWQRQRPQVQALVKMTDLR